MAVYQIESTDLFSNDIRFTHPIEWTSFTDTVPITHCKIPVKEKMKRAMIRGSARKILLADDEPVGREIATELLERHGHTVKVVEDGIALLEMLQNEMFDILLTDISMPEIDGMEVTRIIRSGKLEGIDPLIPIIALTAHAYPQDRLRLIDCGMNGYISKPINFDKLLELVDESCPCVRAQHEVIYESATTNSQSYYHKQEEIMDIEHSIIASPGLTESDLLNGMIGDVKKVFSIMMGKDNLLHLPLMSGPADQSEDCITAMVGIAGTYDGVLSLHTPNNLALDFASSMLGIEMKEFDADAHDALGEIANIIAGSFKQCLTKPGVDIRLSLPSVFVGIDNSVSDEMHNDTLTLCFGAAKQFFRINAYLKGVNWRGMCLEAS